MSRLLAMLLPESPFAEIFPDGIPIVSEAQSPAWLENEGLTPCYFVRLDLLTEEQHLGLWRVFAQRSGEREEAIGCALAMLGLPLRASQVREIVEVADLAESSPEAGTAASEEARP